MCRVRIRCANSSRCSKILMWRAQTDIYAGATSHDGLAKCLETMHSHANFTGTSCNTFTRSIRSALEQIVAAIKSRYDLTEEDSGATVPDSRVVDQAGQISTQAIHCEGSIRPYMSRRRVMEPRIDYVKTAAEARAAMMGLEGCAHQAGLDRGLLELVKLRASLINGCAYCADMHTKVARSQGETEQRLYAISVWRETPFYTERERAALAWTEAVTLISVDHVPDDVYNLARQHFTEKELVDLTMAIVAINAWNRLAIAFRTVPGTFQLESDRRTRRKAWTSRRLAKNRQNDDCLETRVRPSLAPRWHPPPGGAALAARSFKGQAPGRRVAEGRWTEHRAA